MNKLQDVLLRFRKHRYVAAMDIASMFLKVHVNEEDRKYLRFLFRPSKNEKVQVVECQRQIFGSRCSPFIAMNTVRTTAEKMKDELPLGAQAITRDIIVDDVLCGSESIETLQMTIKQAEKILESIGMTCHKFAANHTRILSNVSSERLCKGMKIFEEGKDFENIEEDEKMKTLGVYWNPQEDEFHLNFEASNSDTITLRQMMSEGGQFSDPLQFALPVNMVGRQLLQQAWRYGFRNDLDQQLPEAFVM